MRLFKLSILRKPKSKRTPDETGMLEAYKRPMDFTKKENLKELLAFARDTR